MQYLDLVQSQVCNLCATPFSALKNKPDNFVFRHCNLWPLVLRNTPSKIRYKLLPCWYLDSKLWCSHHLMLTLATCDSWSLWWMLTEHIVQLLFCEVRKVLGNILVSLWFVPLYSTNSIQNPSSVNNPTKELYCILLPFTLPCCKTLQIANQGGK